MPFKGQIKANDIFIDFYNSRDGDFKFLNEILIRDLEPVEITLRIPILSHIFQKNAQAKEPGTS